MKEKPKKMTAAQRHKLKQFVKELDPITGRHTELVSVYIPQDYDMNKIIQHLQQEQGTASNIKSKATRDNVQSALERMIQHLKLFKRTPEHGLAIFSGNVSEREGQQDFQVWSIEPPIPLKQRLYRCDKRFVLEPIAEMCEEKDIFGLVVMDKREGNIALLKGKTILPINSATSAVPGKTRAGGQCLDPETKVLLDNGKLTSIINVQIGDILKSYDFEKKEIIKSECLDVFQTEKRFILRIRTTDEITINASKDHTFFVKKEGMIVEIKADNLKKRDILFHMESENRIMELEIKSIEEEPGVFLLVDIAVESQNFIANGLIVHNSAPRFERLREGAAKDFMKKLADMMKDAFLENKDLRGIIIGGPGHTKNDFAASNYITDQLKRKIIAIKDLSYTGEFGLQELLDKSSDVLAEEEVMEEKKIVGKFFNLLATKEKMVTYGEKQVMEQLKAGTADTILLSEDLDDQTIEDFEQEAEKMGSTIAIISTETREGVQLRDIGKIAAILRYEVQN
ncbi:MAG: hypothetical protein KKG59_04585 [Nanoarchaeota archaeon]|nr:hypothetical protein [Nanoarchaeota archaeon]